MVPNSDISDGGSRLKTGFGDNGSVMNAVGKVAFRSFETGGEYEHFAIGDPEEGYSVFFKTADGADVAAYDVFADAPGDLVNINRVSHLVLRNDGGELVKETLSRTADGKLEIRNMLTFAADATRVTVRMDITNVSKQDLTQVLVKRYCDIDVDTGGPNGWANYQNHFSKDGDSVHAWNQPSEVKSPGKHAHIVNMVAMPSDVLLDQTFIGEMGREQFKTRDNTFPITNSGLHDGIGVLQWEATRLRVGESIRLNMYYDAFCLHSDIPLAFRHDPASVRVHDIAIAGHVAPVAKQPAPTRT